MFDPYRKWLGIPEDRRPPTHYQLLGVQPDEQDREVIEAAVVRQSAYVRNFQVGKYAEHATRILNEISAARICLLDVVKRSSYDDELLRRQEAGKGAKKGAATTNVAPAHDTPDELVEEPETRPSAARQAEAPRRDIPRREAQPARPGAAARAPRAASSARPVRSGSMPIDPLLERAALSAPRHSPLMPRQRVSGNGQAVMQLLTSWTGLALGALLVVAALILAMVLNRGSEPANTLANNDSANLNSGQNSSITPMGQNGGTNTAGSDVRGPRYEAGNGKVGRRPPSNVGGGPSTTSSGTSTGQGTPGTTPRDPAGSSNTDKSGKDSSDANTASSQAGGNDASSSTSEVPINSNWGDDSTISIPVPERDGHITFAKGLSPFVAIGKEVFSLKTGEPTGKFFSGYNGRGPRALSPEGKYFATASDPFGHSVEIWNCETGKQIGDLKGKSTFSNAQFVEFLDATHLLAAFDDSGGSHVQIWDMVSEKMERNFPCETLEPKKAAVSPDGKYVAIAIDVGILVVDIKKKKVVARCMAPDKQTFNSCEGVRFAPDGQQLVAVCDVGKQIVLWNAQGQVVADQRLTVDVSSSWAGAFVYEGAGVEWTPDTTGLLLKGHFLLDRESQKMVWVLRNRIPDVGSRYRFVDDERIAVTRGDGPSRELVCLPIPWTKIRASLAALGKKDPAYLAPYQAVSLDVQTGSLLTGAPLNIAEQIKGILQTRLAAAGVNVIANQKSTFYARYSEKAGTAQRLVTDGRGGPVFGPRGEVSFQQIATVEVLLEIGLMSPGETTPIWSAKMNTSAAQGYGLTPGSELYKELERQLQQIPIPYFIPVDKSLTSLPVLNEI